MSGARLLLCIVFGIIFLVTIIQLLILDPKLKNFSNSSSWTLWTQLRSKNNDNNRTSKYFWNNGEACQVGVQSGPAKTKKMAILILTARKNFERRTLIRETWGSIKNFGGWTVATLVFMLGQSQVNEESWIEEKLGWENSNFGDLVRKNDFVDTYRNLTLKTLMAFEWLLEFCPPEVKLVVKLDDDVFVNIFQLTRALNENPGMENSLNFYGQVIRGKEPVRKKNDRWFVPITQFNGTLYPPYCRGGAYVTTRRVIQIVSKTVAETFDKKFWIEDIFTTGIVPRQFNREMMIRNKQFDETTQNRSEEKIRHFDRNWLFSSDQGSRSDRLRRLYDDGDDDENSVVTNKSRVNSLGAFREKFLSTIFFLVDHGPFFTQDFTQLWLKVRRVEGLQN